MRAPVSLVAAVALGGALGASLRYLTGVAVSRLAPAAGFPWATFAVNIAGCVAFGLLAGALETRDTVGPAARAFLLIGLLGGFTTFSAFAFENVELLAAGHAGRAAWNVGGQLVLGVAGLWAGLSLTRLLG